MLQQLKRLRTAIDLIKSENNFTNDKLAELLGYNKGNYISEILSGSKNLNSFFLKKLSTSFNVNALWIMEGKGEMIDTNENILKENGAVYQTKTQDDISSEMKILKEQLNLALEQNKYLQSIIDRLLPEKNISTEKSNKKYNQSK